MSRDRWRFFDNRFPYFLTCTVVGWLPVFTRPKVVDILFDSLRYLQRERSMSLIGYVFLENHIHFIAGFEDPSRDSGDFKSYTARKIIDTLLADQEISLLKQLQANKEVGRMDRNYQVWQQGSHPELLETEERLRQKLEYIHYNPVKRGYISDPIHWRYSSARNYAGLPALIEVDKNW